MDLSVLKRITGGRYGVAVSGGADSTALLFLLREHRGDVPIHLVHLNHQTRGEESESEERFVAGLADRLGVARTIGRRSEIEPLLEKRPRNKSALFRAMRLKLFADVVKRERLDGVLLAHHAEDQAETVLHRLLRGSGVMGLSGMAEESVHWIGGERLVLRRPLLCVHRGELRDYLKGRGEKWCEDSSNRSEKYARNRLRRVLEKEPGLSEALVELGKACEGLAAWVEENAVELGDEFDVRDLRDLPGLVAERSVRKYLAQLGAPVEEITGQVVERLTGMVNDAATDAKQMFPGGILLRRRRGRIFRTVNSEGEGGN